MTRTEAVPEEARVPADDVEALLEHRETVYLVCLGYTRRCSDAEELAQETYLRAWASRASLREQASTKAWLCRIARNTCLDHLRRAGKGLFRPLSPTTDPAGGDDPEAALEEKERRAALKRAIRGLSRPLRDVLVLREYGELSYEQIAAALGLAPGTVMSRLHRARARVAESVRERGGLR